MHLEPKVITITPTRSWQAGDAVAEDDDTLFVTIEQDRKVRPTYPKVTRKDGAPPTESFERKKEA
jgi:hypothetical protein